MPRSTPTNAGTLRLIVPAECAGRLIGRHGSRIQEVQLRSGARVQISDRGEDAKLVEVSGSSDNIGEAATQILNDLARARPSKGFAESESTVMEVSVGVLVPEALFGWVMGENGYTSPLAIKGVSTTPTGTYDGDAERRVMLLGPPHAVSNSLRILGLRLRRHARWMTSGVTDMPWEVCDEREDGDPEDGHFSTLNFRLIASDAVAAALVGGGENGRLLAQVQEDTGAAIRAQALAANAVAGGRSAVAPSLVEIAGCYSAKLRALLEVSSFLMLLAHQKTLSARAVDTTDALAIEPEPNPQCLLEMLFPASGLGAIRPDEAAQVNDGRAINAEVSTKRRGEDMLVRIRGTRAACCTTAVALARAAERRAADHESIHGPPPLLIDYLVRWFGGDSKRWPHAAIAAQAAAGAIAAGKRRPPSKLGLVARRPRSEQVISTEVATGTSLPSVTMGPEAAPTVEQGQAEARATEAPAGKRGLKRKRRNANLSNPFKAAGEDKRRIGAAQVPLGPALEFSETAATSPGDAARAPAAALVAGYSDDESEAELIPEAEPASDDDDGSGALDARAPSGQLDEGEDGGDCTDDDVVVVELPEGSDDAAVEELAPQAKSSPDGSPSLRACGDCKTLAESGAVDPEDGAWYCRACWEALGRLCPEEPIGSVVSVVPVPAVAPPINQDSDPLFAKRQALLAKLARIL